MIYQQPELPYALDALEPVISKDTIKFHYGKHEKAYIDNLNNLIKGTKYEDMNLEDIIRLLSPAVPKYPYSLSGYSLRIFFAL